MRPGKGCYDQGAPRFGQHDNGRYLTRTCPKRTLMRRPDFGAVLELVAQLGDAGLGVSALDMPASLVTAVSITQSGVAYRRKQELDRQSRGK